MNGLLKFITCGSVDDGKSTLIGHILYDAKLLYADQERSLELESRVGSRGGKIDYSLLLDGLMAEREQGITIDVAYRYFTTDRRSFIVADTPGHEEYTRNMAVGASFADLAVILIDASQGVLIQTRRHARICSLMGIRHFVFAVNKMDLVGYDEGRFQEINGQIDRLKTELQLEYTKVIPLSATEGDNVTSNSSNMPWYHGGALLPYLETVETDHRDEEEGFYLPVQRVCRPDHTFRGFQGQIESGEISVGSSLIALPSREEAHVRSILAAGREVTTACKGQPVTIQLDREVDVSRGCVLVSKTMPAVSNQLEATLLWMDDISFADGRNFFVKLGTKLIPGEITSITYRVDVNTGEHCHARILQKNEIASCTITLAQPIVLDEFSRHKTLGELILIDRITNATSACGVVSAVRSSRGADLPAVTAQTRAHQKGQTPFLIVAETASAALELERSLMLSGLHTMTLGKLPSPQLIFAARLLREAGLIVLTSHDVLSDELLNQLFAETEGKLLDLRLEDEHTHNVLSSLLGGTRYAENI